MKSLRTLRKEKGYTVTALARVCTTTHPHISRIERGLISPSQDTRLWIEQNVFQGEKINWLDTPHLITSPVYETNWNDTEREFRAFVRLLKGLPEEQRPYFIKSAVKHLRKLI